MKKSFTLAETLVTLTVLGIIMAIVIPLISKARPDKDVIMFKKALYSLQSAVGNATEELLNEGAMSNTIWSDDIVTNVDPKGFCNRISAHLNTTGNGKCGNATSADGSDSHYYNPQIVTTDGMRFWHVPNKKIAKNSSVEICVERPLSNSELSTLKEARGNGNDGSLTDKCGADKAGSTTNVGLRVKVYWDGKVHVPENTYEAKLIDRSFEVQKQ